MISEDVEDAFEDLVTFNIVFYSRIFRHSLKISEQPYQDTVKL